LPSLPLVVPPPPPPLASSSSCLSIPRSVIAYLDKGETVQEALDQAITLFSIQGSLFSPLPVVAAKTLAEVECTPIAVNAALRGRLTALAPQEEIGRFAIQLLCWLLVPRKSSVWTRLTSSAKDEAKKKTPPSRAGHKAEAVVVR